LLWKNRTLSLVDKPLKSVTHGQCDARPTVTFPAAGQRLPCDWYQIILLGDRGICCDKLDHNCYT